MKNIKVIVCLFVLFALGAASGVGITKTVQPSRAAKRTTWSEQAWLDRRYQEECRRLNLTPEQQEAMRVRYDELAAGMREVREETAKKIGDLFVKKAAEDRKSFTPEQREEYRKLNEERRARYKKPTS
jgi:hypothetical protein